MSYDFMSYDFMARVFFFGMPTLLILALVLCVFARVVLRKRNEELEYAALNEAKEWARVHYGADENQGDCATKIAFLLWEQTRVPISKMRPESSLSDDLRLGEIDARELVERLIDVFNSAPKDLKADYTFDSVVQFYAPQLPENANAGPNPTTTRL